MGGNKGFIPKTLVLTPDPLWAWREHKQVHPTPHRYLQPFLCGGVSPPNTSLWLRVSMEDLDKECSQDQGCMAVLMQWLRQEGEERTNIC